MFGPGLVAARVSNSSLIRGLKVSAGRGSLVINRTPGLLSDFPPKGDAFVVVVDVRAFHATCAGSKVLGEFQGHGVVMLLGVGLSPIKSHSEKSATGAA